MLTALAAPAALGFETLLRGLLFPDDFEILRAYLREPLTLVAWALVGLCVVLALLGSALQRRLGDRATARLPADRRTPEGEARARLGAFMLAASVPQVPAVLCTVAFMMGASLTPVLVAMAIVTVAVVVQGVRAGS